MSHSQIIPVTLDFDFFLSGLRAMCVVPYCSETSFCIEDDTEYRCCWLGCLKGEKPYWFGLVPDGSQAYEFATAEELIDAKVFRGSSLRALWPKVRFYTIGDIDPMTWLSRYTHRGHHLEIAKMRPDDYDQKSYVHWKSWQETYTGLMDERYIANQTLEKCRNIAHRWPGNTLLVHLDGQIVGYGCYISHEDGTGEISAIYLLKEAQGLGIGRRLMDALLEKLAGHHPIVLWVLKGNDRAIGFYEHYGFRMDGTEKTAPVGTELRMTCNPETLGDCHTS